MHTQLYIYICEQLIFKSHCSYVYMVRNILTLPKVYVDCWIYTYLCTHLWYCWVYMFSLTNGCKYLTISDLHDLWSGVFRLGEDGYLNVPCNSKIMTSPSNSLVVNTSGVQALLSNALAVALYQATSGTGSFGHTISIYFFYFFILVIIRPLRMSISEEN